eukprot:5108996-Pleurochrysis_carterae.AAC.2
MATLAALKSTCEECDCQASAEQRTVRAHQPVVEGEDVRPCDCCTFCHDRSTAQAEHEAFEARLQALRKGCETKGGKRDLAAFIAAHKKKHHSTNPGPAGVPLTFAGLQRWIVDLLHVDLNLGKLVWKWGLT